MRHRLDYGIERNFQQEKQKYMNEWHNWKMYGNAKMNGKKSAICKNNDKTKKK